MSLKYLKIACFSLFVTATSFAQQKKVTPINLTQFVNPLIGSAEHGHVFVGANVPFGAVQLGPVNIFEGWDWCSGYNYASNTILGFTHTHLSGTGIGDLSDILLLPFTGKTFVNKISKDSLENGYGSTFSHQNEKVKAGFYSVFLDRYQIKAKLTASERVGFHQYQFPAKADAHILIDLTDGVGWDAPVETYLKQVSATKIVGYRQSKGWAADQKIYFAMEYAQPIANLHLFNDATPLTGTEAKGQKIKAVLDFDLKNKTEVLVKVGISPVSIENASQNIAQEIPHWNFEQTVKNADEKWNKELNKIEITADEKTKTIFYTAMYHTAFAPSLFNDHNKDYFGTDKKVHKNASFNNYTTFSLWDTYRALHPLFTITQADKVNDFVNSFLAIYQQQGRLPVWHLMGNETDCMNGNHSIPVIVDAYFKGFRKYDVKLAYEALKTTAMQTRAGMNYVQKTEHIPADTLLETVANALEYAIDDWCIAQMAKDLNKKEDFDYFTKRSLLYQKYFDKETQFMRGKLANGDWKTPFNPLSSEHRKNDYVEGNAWQYTWLVPQDPNGLVKLFDGEANFSKKLDQLFLIKEALVGEDVSPDISGLIGQYAQGNEPGHHIPYLYSFVGEPWKTAKIVREVADKFYTNQPNGICGNEDLGQMSAWYIFSSMGFYPVNPANGEYVFGTPLLNKAVIKVANNNTFVVEAINRTHENIYIQNITLNGKAYDKNYLNHQTLQKGGVLKIYMGATPSPTWGTQKTNRPN